MSLLFLIYWLSRRQRKQRKKNRKIIYYYKDEFGKMVYYTIAPDGTTEYIDVVFR